MQTLTDSVGRAIVRQGVLPSANDERNGIVWTVEKAIASPMGATSTFQSDYGRAIVSFLAAPARLLFADVTFLPDADALIPLWAVFVVPNSSGGPIAGCVPFASLPFFPCNSFPITKRFQGPIALKSGLLIALSASPLALVTFAGGATLSISAQVGQL